MDIFIVEPVFERQDARGTFQEIIRGQEWRTVIVGHMHAGSEMGHHYHLETLIFFYLTNGTAQVTIENVETRERQQLELHVGQGVLIPPGHSHVIHYLQESDFLLLKSLSYDPENPDTTPYHVSR
jgi:mannose-6-phosphate isomerase-like protein (cupin superfamily)